MANLRDYDNYKSFELVVKNIDEQVRKGELSEYEAKKIIALARENYKKDAYGRLLDRMNVTH